MTAPTNFTGQQFGRLTVINRHPENAKDGQARWNCECDCGNGITVTARYLKEGTTRSCGCLAAEVRLVHSQTHGLSNSSEYRVWQGIKKRCYNPTHQYYHNYGGRGITMCDEWKNSFEAFYKDMGPRPSLEYTIEREDSDLGYYKGNCRWATRLEQGNNTRRNVYYEFDGERKTLSAWCRELNLNYKAMHYQLSSGKSFEDAADYLSKKTT